MKLMTSFSRCASFSVVEVGEHKTRRPQSGEGAVDKEREVVVQGRIGNACLQDDDAVHASSPLLSYPTVSVRFAPTSSIMNGGSHEGLTAPSIPHEPHSKKRAVNFEFPDGAQFAEDGRTAECVASANTRCGEYKRLMSNPRDELRQFRSGLFWLGLDQSTKIKVTWSWILFFLLSLVVPIINFAYVSCKDCDEAHEHPFERMVRYSESVLAAISFLCLSHILRTYGLRRTLLLDKIIRESSEVRQGYEAELHRAFSLLAWIILPCFLVELVHKVWWFIYVSVSIPLSGDPRTVKIAMCTAAMLSWFYKASVFLFMCVLFRLMCSLQILRLKGYSKLLAETPEVSIILSEHMRIGNQLRTISHRFRLFMVASLFTITFSQLSSLFVILLSARTINFFRAGDLGVCSLVQLTGLLLCLNGAAKITHRAQRLVPIVSQWHAIATCSPLAVAVPVSESNTEPARTFSAVNYGPTHPLLYNNSSDDLERSIHICSNEAAERVDHDLKAYQKRQALVTYLQHSRTGISLYGFVLDRSLLYMIFGVEFSLTLFILGKTIFA